MYEDPRRRTSSRPPAPRRTESRTRAHASPNGNARAAIGALGFVATLLGVALAQAADKILSGVGGNYLTQVLQHFGWLTPAGTIRDVAWFLFLFGILVLGTIAVPAASSMVRRVRYAGKVHEAPAATKMRADAFICASTKDEELAQRVCSVLERDGLSCWMAKRDLLPGKSEGEQLADAIRASGVILLLFTKQVNDDTSVQDDLGYARKHNVRIFPLRFDNVEPVGFLDRMTARLYWFDGTQVPLESALDALAPRVRALLADAGIPLESATNVAVAPPDGSRRESGGPQARVDVKLRWSEVIPNALRYWSRLLGMIVDERDVEELLELPVLASIPLFPTVKALPPDLRNAALEAYFQLVLAIRYSSDRPLRTVTFTGVLKGDGASTIAMNAAGAFGEIAVSSIERQARVLIIDANLRRPSLHRKFDVSNEIGLSDILIGRTTLADCVKRTDRPGVDLLTSGSHSPNPIKLLQSSRLDVLLREARERYEMVIFDGPALVPAIDSAVLAAKTDGTVMVVSAGHTDVQSTRKALRRFEAVGVDELLGVVVNRATVTPSDYSLRFAAKPLPRPAKNN